MKTTVIELARVAMLMGALAGCAATPGPDDAAASGDARGADALDDGATSALDGANDAALDASAASDAGSDASPDAESVANVRGLRYCEVLVGTLASGQVHIDVYNTFGLNDCPMDAWSALDANRLAAEMHAATVILNGPRYWVMDAFVNTMLLDPTPRMFGALAMRRAGALDVPLAEAMAGMRPYAQRTVSRTTTWVYTAGRPVYELVDPSGAVFAMQSYSVQNAALTEAMLPDLAARLALPTGWMYRARMPTSDLRVTAVGGVATIVQDDLGNTYQREQP